MEIPEELQSAPKINVERGTKVFQQGQSCQNYYLALEGSIKVFARSSSGKEILLYRVTPGDICVLTTSCMLSNSPYPADAVAESDVSAIALPKVEFKELMHRSEQFRAYVLNSFGSRLSGLIALVEHIALDSIELRLARYLLNATDRDNQILAATHQDIATEIGTAREVVSRQLKILSAKELVAVNRGNIIVLDRTALEQLGRS